MCSLREFLLLLLLLLFYFLNLSQCCQFFLHCDNSSVWYSQLIMILNIRFSSFFVVVFLVRRAFIKILLNDSLFF
uniref:Uncharacterized protein n=1 Tax=Anguilla anguilla TaxID=7936 RepID=A0A0E9WLM1_ANGAN